MKFFLCSLFLTLTTSIALFSAHPAQSHRSKAPIQEPEFSESLSRDWHGSRIWLKEQGVDIYASYVNDLLGNPVGGKHKGFANAGSFGLDIAFDFEKIAKAKGFQLFSSFVFRSGTNLSAKRIDNQFPVAQEFGGETYRLNELYLRENFYDLASIKAGRLDGANDFLASPLYQDYVSNAICGNPISIFFNTPFSVYPFATWGAYFDFKLYRSLLLKWAVYNNNPEIFQNKFHGCNFTFESTKGIFLITEWAYLLNQNEGSEGLPGNYKAGYYYITGEVAKFRGGQQKGNYGWYLLLDQMIYRRNTASIIPFAAFMFAPENRNEFPFFLSGGIVYKGFIPSRKLDQISLGVAYGLYSDSLRHIEREAKINGTTSVFGHRPQTFETVIEANYWIYPAPWIALTPDIQYVINPKGYGTIQNALVLGIQVSVTL